MLIRFEIENWMSFRGRAVLSMIASRERQHGERVPTLSKYGPRVLPIAAVYGGNASGKSNLFKALGFARAIVVRGTPPDGTIPVEPFGLQSGAQENPSEFSFELLVGETVYEFGFALTSRAIHKEWLREISNSSERDLYRRDNGHIEFGSALQDDEFLNFAFRGTRENQLFLTNSVSQKVDRFKPIYNWFKENLILIAPEARFGSIEKFIDEGSQFYKSTDDMLARLDTGIVHLLGEDVDFDTLRLPEEVRRHVQDAVNDGKTVRLSDETSNRLFTVTRSGGRTIVKKLVTHHRRLDGSLTKFELSQESDGTIRIIDLLPAFLDLSSGTTSRVYVVDELDRSLHTLLTQQLVRSYLSACSQTTRSQLLFTTHDVLLMDQSILRRDEMWVAERNANGESSLSSFSEYRDVRYDKDVRKSYLQGRLGGVPRLLLSGAMAQPRCVDSEEQ